MSRLFVTGLKTVCVVTPVELPDRIMSPLVGDRILEGLCEGVTRANFEMMRAGMVYDGHPYNDAVKLVYGRDPTTLGTLRIDGAELQAREYWATVIGAYRRGHDDCETLSAVLAAWYRNVIGVNASCAIYPTIVAQNGVVGRHVVVWVPLAEPIYTIAPYDSSKFIRKLHHGKGYIEDPSVALGMYYTSGGDFSKLPSRNSISFNNAALLRRAEPFKVPYLPAHWIAE